MLINIILKVNMMCLHTHEKTCSFSSFALGSDFTVQWSDVLLHDNPQGNQHWLGFMSRQHACPIWKIIGFKKIPLAAKLDSACGLVQFWLSSEFFSSNYFQIGQHVVLLHIQIVYVRVIDQVWGQDGWILAKFFFACLWSETKSRSIISQKKNEANILDHLDRTNLVNKGFIICLSGKFFKQDTAGSPDQARWLHLARSGSQSQRAIWFILPACGASHIIKIVITQQAPPTSTPPLP